MDIAGVVILYHPDSSAIENIETYLPLLQVLYIYDNTEEKNEALHAQLQQLQKTVVIHDGSNRGIAQRLNAAASLCLQQQQDWLLTMDQDSAFEKNIFKHYVDCISAKPNNNNTAMYGINHEVQQDKIDCTFKEVTHLITSGSLLNLHVFKKIGGFDEALFIDEVDIEYCYRANSQNFKTILLPGVFLRHQLGDISYHKSFKSFKTTPRTLHSPLRLYYMVRNHFYVNKKYPDKFAAEKKIRKKDLLNRIKNNFLYGDQRVAVIKNVFAGWYDYKNIKMGKKS